MTDGMRKRESRSSASPAAKRWLAWREEARAAAEEDRELSLKARAEKKRQIEREYHNPVAVYFGLLMLLFILAVGWFVVDWMRCDPFYSDLAMSHGRACR
jgi:hypothetical protein